MDEVSNVIDVTTQLTPKGEYIRQFLGAETELLVCEKTAANQVLSHLSPVLDRKRRLSNISS